MCQEWCIIVVSIAQRLLFFSLYHDSAHIYFGISTLLAFIISCLCIERMVELSHQFSVCVTVISGEPRCNEGKGKIIEKKKTSKIQIFLYHSHFHLFLLGIQFCIWYLLIIFCCSQCFGDSLTSGHYRRIDKMRGTRNQPTEQRNVFSLLVIYTVSHLMCQQIICVHVCARLIALFVRFHGFTFRWCVQISYEAKDIKCDRQTANVK